VTRPGSIFRWFRLLLLGVVVLLGAAAVVLARRDAPVEFTDLHTEIAPLEPEMVDIPAGPFKMGNPAGTPEEQPVIEVTLSDFSIGKYEVTCKEWKRFADATGRSYPMDPIFAENQSYFVYRPDHPVIEISWNDAAAYCAWLAKRTGKPYHLPTSAQWEKAARGGLDGKIYPWGDDHREGMARMNLSWSEGTVKVGSYPPNGYGLYDMVGNVNEMTADWYGETYYHHSPRVDPLGPSGFWNYFSLIRPTSNRSRLKGRCKVVRGGSYRAPWDWVTKNPDGRFETPVQVGAREYLYQQPYTHFDLGFRVAMGGLPPG
jgi:formylglycine-generating enzyme required for sulfatase activity